MSDSTSSAAHDKTPIPADDSRRKLTVADPEDRALRHIAMVGDTYTIVVAGEDTDGRYALIDMLVPPGGGPPPHRHDFDEMFHVLDGEIEVTFRGEVSLVREGQTANVPANAPHAFCNPTDHAVRLLCLVSPSGLEEFFAEVGDVVDSRTSQAPELGEAEMTARMQNSRDLAAKYGIEVMPPE
ncbi:MAG: cupin domain-containing protein [Actinomycetota bacterium]|nr:cupin domain-containing protein [Actinomycetota bacterium]